MDLYAFELGRKKELCLAELLAVLGEENLVEKNLDTAIFRLNETQTKNLQGLQNSLGGTIKIVEIFAEGNQIKETVKKYLEENFKDITGKIPFSVTILSQKNPDEVLIKTLLISSKKILKELGLNSRFVNQNSKNTKPSTIYKARVVEKGVDINIIYGIKNTYIGKTVAIQNIDAYSLRDFDRPKRDAKVGMLPPKLAQIMINLALPQAKEKETIYDPFCGTGVIPMEGLLLGYDVIGSDIDSRMVEYTQENCDWLIKTFKLEKPPTFRTFKNDARFLAKTDLPEKITAIVTEGYLGPALTKFPTEEEQEKTFRELANLHLNWLKQVHTLTPKDVRIVTCLTAFKKSTSIIHFPRFKELANLAGYKIENTYSYDREDQIVVRDIVILTKI
ncbi:hypothetical protein M0P48_03260 [Candidatus Gracilibacteria bacterium]|nr:hypothetical protein [Candidatus Gracilibacteria bacterium]